MTYSLFPDIPCLDDYVGGFGAQRLTGDVKYNLRNAAETGGLTQLTIQAAVSTMVLTL